MKKKFFYLLFSCLACTASAQVYQNEWIDYNKTYYKFKVGPFGYDIVGAPVKKGVVRINQPVLVAAGLSNIPAEQFQLWRDGEEVPLYISKTTGILSNTDYIEFWGEIANGKPDRALYNDTISQLSDYWNLESDSAAYFLTVNGSGNNKRFVHVSNNVSSVTLPAEKNFMYKIGRYYRNEINQGYHVRGEQDFYLSIYAVGEGFTSRAVHRNGSIYGKTEMPQTFPKLYLDTTGDAMTASFSMVGNSPYGRNVKMLLNGETLTQFSMGFFLSSKQSITGIPANRIKCDTAYFVVQNLSGADDDDLRVATIELEYPRLFNFDGATSFEFYVAASEKGRYLKIAKFNKGNDEAVLYDITNGKRYIADTTIKDTLQFLLQPSQEKYHLVLVKGDSSTATFINTLQQRKYTDFNQTVNQGDYLIITHPSLYESGADNYIQQYKDYRSSADGGAFNAKIIDIHELEDQFAYGISMHPLAVKNFLRFARANFKSPPAYAFLIGKGVTYTSYRFNETNPLTAQLNLVPVFGAPGSDNLLSSENNSDVPATPIGRLSAVSSAEVGTYLEKIKQYESAQRDTSNVITEKLWMKKVLHLAGTSDASLTYMIDSFQRKYTQIISDTLLGADVSTYSKTADSKNYAQSLLDFTNQYNEGSALVEYLGHSSSTSIDFNLDDPSKYNNKGRYPVLIVNGCLAGNIFDYEANRLTTISTLSEKFTLEPERGAIGYLSSSNYTLLNYINLFTKQIYTSTTSNDYGSGFGKIIKDGIGNVLTYTGPNDFYSRMHAEQLTFNGDPALKINSAALPDFAIDSAEIITNPSYLSVSADSFTVKIIIHNLGKATNDSVHFYLLRKFPNGMGDTAFYGKISSIKSTDSLTIKLPVVINRDKGTTILTAIIDDNNVIAETSEKNNTATAKVRIGGAEVLPVYPYNYSIVNTNTVNLSATTVYDSLTRYVAEVDTTALFNSPVKISQNQVSKGGLITFPNIPLTLNNTVYFWRVSEDSTQKHWNTFSFIYRDGSNTGFEQAHFLQHTQSAFNGISPDSSTRSFNFAPALSNLFIQHSVYPTSGTQDAQFSVTLNGSIFTWSACVGSSIIFNILDPKTLKPVLNSTLPYNAGYICNSMRQYNFEYSTQSADTRKNAMDFLDNYVPNGYYVVARKIYDLGNTDWAPTVWASDTALYGHNNSLYHRLKDQGVAIDSFNYPRTFCFIFKKNDSANYQPVSVLSKGLYDRITTSQNLSIFDTTGTITSPLFGPGKAWNKVKWNGTSESDNNTTTLDVVTVDNNGKDSVWFKINSSQHELDISAINAALYPYIKLCMHTKDGVEVKPYNLQDWSVEFTPVAEGAIAPNLGMNIPKTLQFDHEINAAFDTLQGYVVFKNIGTAAFDSLTLKLVLYDEHNKPHAFALPKTRTLLTGDTLHVSFLVNVSELPQGLYNLYLEVNPDNDQPEQYHYNNTLFSYIRITRGLILPLHLLDFTATPVNRNAQLQWIVSNETNVAKYVIEFSNNGTAFNSIATINATAAQAPKKTYSFIHTSTVNNKNFYRIKMTDNDGKFTYSPIRVVIFSNNVLVYPNPFSTLLNVESNNSLPSTAELFDISGKLLLKQIFTSNTTLHINDIARGMYILRINDGETIRSFKVYKE